MASPPVSMIRPNAAPSGHRPALLAKRLLMVVANSVVPAPPSSIGAANAPRLIRKTSEQPDAMPSRVRGRVTRRNCCHGPAPSPAAASRASNLK